MITAAITCQTLDLAFVSESSIYAKCTRLLRERGLVTRRPHHAPRMGFGKYFNCHFNYLTACLVPVLSVPGVGTFPLVPRLLIEELKLCGLAPPRGTVAVFFYNLEMPVANCFFPIPANRHRLAGQDRRQLMTRKHEGRSW